MLSTVPVQGTVSLYTKVSEVTRKVGTDKAFPQRIKSLMEQNECLLANRRGNVENLNEQEKPTFYPEELIANRKRGLSFSCIGKKLGIDNTKGEVLNVFTVMKDIDNTLTNVENVECPIVRSLPTPLWYLFESELDIIAKESVPDVKCSLITLMSMKFWKRSYQLL